MLTILTILALLFIFIYALPLALFITAILLLSSSPIIALIIFFLAIIIYSN